MREISIRISIRRTQSIPTVCFTTNEKKHNRASYRGKSIKHVTPAKQERRHVEKLRVALACERKVYCI